MRILHVVPWANLGGVERSVLNLCRALGARRSAVLFQTDGPAVAEFSRQRIPVLVLDQLLRDTDGARRLQAFAARCAIVHMHCMWDQPGVRRMADRLGLPLVVTLHGRARLPRLSCPVICVSDVVAHEQPRGTRVSVIPNSVDTRIFRYRDPRPAESFRVIRVCRKGRCADYFWEAAELVLAAEPNAEFWVVGERGRSRKRVRFLGVRSDVPELLAACDVFAYAPIPDFGVHDNCVLEAMAVGVPPVATDVTGVRESVTSGVNGLLVPFGDALALADGILSLRDWRLRRRLGRGGRVTVRTCFSTRRVADRHEEIYAECE